MTFEQHIAREMYKKVRGLGDRLELMKHQINWERFRPIVASVFKDNEKTGGRPHTDEVIIVRTMLLQSWYGLSDEELEFQSNDRLSFRNFLGFPENVPDFSSIWKIRERLKDSNKEAEIWAELQSQLNAKGLTVKKGVVQDASFIEAPIRRKKGDNLTKKQLSHINKDGTFAVKKEEVHFGYKLHGKIDVDYKLIRELDTTTASVHDSQINLLKTGDVAAYRDKGYYGVSVPPCVANQTMLKAQKYKMLNGGQLKRNMRINKIRSPCERSFAVLKEVFGCGYLKVTTCARVHIKNMFACFAYNLYQLVTLKRLNLA